MARCYDVANLEPSPDPEGMPRQWLDAVLEEYRSLRAEATTSVVGFGVTILVALVGLAVARRTDGSFAGGILAGLIPVLLLVGVELIAAQIARSVRAGAYLAAIEERLASYFASAELPPPMAWETYLRGHPNRRTWLRPSRGLTVMSFLLTTPLLVTCGEGIHLLWHEHDRFWTYVAAAWCVVAFLILVTRLPAAIKRIAELDRAEVPENIWSPKAFNRTGPHR